MNEKEFKIKVFSLKDAMFRFALSLLIDKDNAEDVTQEVLISLWEKRKKLSEIQNLKSFVMKSIKNKCLNILRYHNKFSLVPIENLLYSYHVEWDLNDLNKTNQMEMIKKIILTLPRKRQMIIHLRDIEGYNFDEIGAIMEMEYNAVRTSLSRARKMVRERYHQSISQRGLYLKKNWK